MTRPPSSPRWLVLAFGLALVGVLAGGVWLYRTQKQSARQRVETELQAIAQLKVNQIAAWRAERTADAATLMDSPFFVEGVARWMAAPSADGAERILVRLRSLQRYRNLHDVLLLDDSGRARLSVSGRRESSSRRCDIDTPSGSKAL